ncbi:hypothetical protein D3C78_1931000 [compost metagenome]
MATWVAIGTNSTGSASEPWPMAAPRMISASGSSALNSPALTTTMPVAAASVKS